MARKLHFLRTAYMSPCASFYNVAYRLIPNSKFTRQFRVRCFSIRVFFSYLHYLLFGKYGISIITTAIIRRSMGLIRKSKMAPRVSGKDVANARFRNAIFYGKPIMGQAVRNPSSPNIDNLIPSKSSSGIIFSLCASLSSFVYLISMVISRCSKKQVIGIYARWIIAVMQNLNAIRYIAVKNLPRPTMRSSRNTIYGKCSIPSTHFSTNPFPTLRLLCHLFKKLIHKVIVHKPKLDTGWHGSSILKLCHYD